MPVHDWTRVDAGLFHAFHHGWICKLCDALNTARLPPDYYSLIEPNRHGSIADGMQRSEAALYADKADCITVRHRRGNAVAVIEIVSPGNKSSRADLRAFVTKSVELIRQKVHLMVIDLFPPGLHDPQGIHKAIWDEIDDARFELPPGRTLTLAAYDAGPSPVAYVDCVAVGDILPDMPLFLAPEFYLPAPLESTYQTTWNAFPAVLKRLLETPAPKPPETTA